MTREEIRNIVWQVVEDRMPPSWAVIKQVEIESGFDNTLVSPTGCVGVFQIDPKFCQNPGYGIWPCKDPLDPKQAAHYACDFLVAAYKHHGLTSWGKAFLCYNVGIGSSTLPSLAYRQLATAVDVLGV